MRKHPMAALGNKTKDMLEKLTRHPTLKNLLQQGGGDGRDDEYNGSQARDVQAALIAAQNSSGKWIKELSSMANVVVGRCARILLLKPEDLKLQFEEEAPVSAKETNRYARNLLEYCCFRALAVATQVPDHLRDKDFRRWTFDMMLAWEAPAAVSMPGLSLDGDTSASLRAFARMAPAVATAADSVTVHSLFETLTGSPDSRMGFDVYNKYLIELDRTIKGIKAQNTASVASALGIRRGEENVIEIDGAATQPVLQHVGVTAWPGRLTLSDQGIYFEASGVVAYDAAKKYDLSLDQRHIVKPDMTGPWGARIFDKAVVYKSSSTPEPIVLEFPELTGHMRRDYWLAIIKEIIAVHAFIRNYKLDGAARSQALAKAVLGIARIKAIWSIQKSLPNRAESLLTFVSADQLPGGDLVLKALAAALRAGERGKEQAPPTQVEASPELVRTDSRRMTSGASSPAEKRLVGSPRQLSLGASTSAAAVPKEQVMPVGEVLVGEMTALERAIMASREDSKQVEKAKATEVRVDGIGTNVALMKELCVPIVAFGVWMRALVCWDEPAKTIAFLAIFIYIIYKDWLGYLVPLLLLTNVALILWLRYQHQKERLPPGRRNEVVVLTPPQKSAVEQIMVLQQALAQVESAIQGLNIALLKARALIVSEMPQASDEIIAAHVVGAVLVALLPFRIVVLIVVLDVFTRQLEFRKEGTRRLIRRITEWWYRIPAVPVRFLEEKSDE